MFSHHERVNMAISKSGLPKTVLELFDPRQDLEYRPPIDKKPPVLPLIGLAGYVAYFPEQDDPEYQPERNELAQSENRKYRSKEYHLQVSISEPTILERREAKIEARKAAHAAQLESALATYDAKSDPNADGTDAMRTLFVSRLDYSTTESDLYAEFEKHGAIRQLKLIRTPDGKSRGYAFIEYQHGGDMKKAYKAYPETGVRIGASERYSLVDVERGRTVQGWKPMRLGGGKGGETRLPKAKKEKKASGAGGAMPPPPAGGQADRDRRGGFAPGEPRAPYSRPDRDRGPDNGTRERDRFAGGPPRDRPAGHMGGRAERDRGDDYGGGRDRLDRRDGRSGYRDDRGAGNGYREDRVGGNSYRDRDGYSGYKRERGDDRGYGDRGHGDRGYGSFENRGASGQHGGPRGSYGDRERRGYDGGGYGGDRERDSKRGRHDNGYGRAGGEYGGSRDRGERGYGGDRGYGGGHRR